MTPQDMGRMAEAELRDGAAWGHQDEHDAVRELAGRIVVWIVFSTAVYLTGSGVVSVISAMTGFWL